MVNLWWRQRGLRADGGGEERAKTVVVFWDLPFKCSKTVKTLITVTHVARDYVTYGVLGDAKWLCP
jgi:hypothetical protein